MPEARCPRVLHLPLNTPYAKKMRENGRITICNGFQFGQESIPSEITFEWIMRQSAKHSFWNAFDILHVHFGFEFEPFETVEKTLDMVRAKKKLIVFTCHEIESVHGTVQSLYEGYLRLIGRKSDAVITLTEEAKQSLQSKFPSEYQRIEVIPHGYVVPPDNPLFGFKEKKSEEVHFTLLGTFRSNRIIYSTVVNLHFATLSKRSTISFLTKPLTEELILRDPNFLPFLNFMKSHNTLRLIMSPYFLDDEVFEKISTADVLILPYSKAGHSGQFALALDLGVIPLVTNVGFIRAQFQESMHPNLSMPPVKFVDWNDGRPWEYQKRMVEAALDICENIKTYREELRSSSKGWKKYRQEEHVMILNKHYAIYAECLL